MNRRPIQTLASAIRFHAGKHAEAKTANPLMRDKARQKDEERKPLKSTRRCVMIITLCVEGYAFDFLLYLLFPSPGTAQNPLTEAVFELSAHIVHSLPSPV